MLNSRTLSISFIVFILSLVGLSITALAQDASPVATPSGPSEGYPIGIYEGTCTEPSTDPIVDVGNAVAVGVEGESIAESDVIGPEITETVVVVSGIIDMSLDDFTSSPHVIAVHADEGEQGTIVACGQIAGVTAQGQLAVAVIPVGESTVVGIAFFNEDVADMLDLEAGQTQVTFYGFDQGLAEPVDIATPAA